MTSIEMCSYLITKIEKYLPKRHYSYYVVYSGKSLEVTSKDVENSTRLYIRIITLGNNAYAVDMSNISLDPNMQHRGLFTNLMTDLMRTKKEPLKELWVSSVMTPQMHNACKKLRMNYCKDIGGYKWKKL